MQAKRPKQTLVREKYTFIVALLATILAFGAFKDGLKGAHVSIGFSVFNLLQVSIVFSIILAAAVYFFALEYVRRTSESRLRKFFKWLPKVADALCFVGIVILPIGVLSVWGVTELTKHAIPFVETIINTKIEFSASVLDVLQVLSSAIAVVATALSSWMYAKQRELTLHRYRAEAAMSQRDLILEDAEKLYRQGFFSSAVVEFDKLVSFGIEEAIRRMDHVIKTGSFIELIRIAESTGMLTSDEIESWRKLHETRNRAVHTITKLTKKDADQVLGEVEKLQAALERIEIDLGQQGL